MPRPRQVFISYAYEDAPTARAIARSLGDEDFNVSLGEWPLDPGTDLQEGITRAIGTSDAAVVLLSRAAVESAFVRDEIELLLPRELDRRGIDLVPVVVGDCSIPENLRDRGVVDLRGQSQAQVQVLVQRLRQGSAVDMSSLSPDVFEELVADVLGVMGYAVERPADPTDQRFDFTARNEERGSVDAISEEVWLVEVKHYSSERVSPNVIKQFSHYLENSATRRGILVTSGHLTSVAKEVLIEIDRQSGIELRVIDGTQLRHRILASREIVSRYFPRTHGK